MPAADDGFAMNEHLYMKFAILLVVVLGLASIGLLMRGWYHLRLWRIVRGGGYTGAGLVVLVMAVLGGFAILDLTGYQRLNSEQPVAIIRFHADGPATYIANLTSPDGIEGRYRLQGQDWRLDARVLKWRSWVERLGFAPLYQLRRLGGRYDSVTQARSQPHTVYELGSTHGLDVWIWVRRLHPFFADAEYGSSVYLPMAAGAEYRVTLSATGLIARPENRIARDALAGWR